MLNKSFFLNTDQIFKTLVAIIFTCFATTASSAQDNDPFEITVYGSFIHTKTVPNALFFFNKIEQYDSFEFRRALRNHDIDTVVLGSNGGSVWEGLSMAGIIHDRGIATYVPELPDDMGCYSACAFMFFGGQIRQADGVLAVHQTGYYDSERDGQKEKVSRTQQSTQFTVSEIIGFLNEFETPPWVYEKMFRSREFYEFDKEEKTLLSNREDEISSPNIYAVNGFITSFFKHLADLETKEKTTNIQQPSTLTVEQERKLLVTKIQKLLNAAGCNAGIEDGIWGRRTQAAAELFAKTAKLPTTKSDFLSETFIRKLRAAKANFCPKQAKNLPHISATYLKGRWKLTTTCNSYVIKQPIFQISYLRSSATHSTYTTKPYVATVTHNYAGNSDIIMFGRIRYDRARGVAGKVYRKNFGGCFTQLKKIG